MIIKIKPDLQKSKALQEMARITLERLNTTNQDKYPSNTLTDYYDVLHKLMEAKTLESGIKCKGDGAHQELIEHLAKEKIIDERTRVLLQELREYRNRIAYEGFSIPASYMKQRKKLFDELIIQLRK